MSAQPPEELEVSCPRCHGARWVRVDVPLDHPRFGEIEPCTCWKEETTEQRHRRFLRYSNLGALARLTFETLSPEGRSGVSEDQRLFRQAVSTAWDFAEEPSGWLVLCGPSGCGKTHLAVAIAHRAIEAGRPALFMVVPDLLDHLRATFAPEAEVAYDLLFEQVRESPLLILDDLGAHSSTRWAQEKLFQILNHRQNLALPTVIVLAEASEGLDERLRTRLADPSLAQRIHLAAARPRSIEGIGTVPPPLLEEMTFERFDVRGNRADARQRDILTIALQTAKSYARNPEGHWQVFMGPTGVGKTHLAVAIINERLRGGNPTFFARVADLLDHLRAAYAPDSRVSYDERFEQLKSAPLLVLDDLGSQNTTPWAEEKLYQLLVHRHDARLPTVITTDNKVELKPAIASRINDVRFVNVIEIEAPEYRDQAPRPPSDRPAGPPPGGPTGPPPVGRSRRR